MRPKRWLPLGRTSAPTREPDAGNGVGTARARGARGESRHGEAEQFGAVVEQRAAESTQSVWQAHLLNAREDQLGGGIVVQLGMVSHVLLDALEHASENLRDGQVR